jgi:predicted GNAT family acetyltransferase
LTESYADTESFTRFRAANAEDYYARTVLPRVLILLDEHLSFFSRHQTTGEIVGYVLAGDFYLDRLRFDPTKSGHYPFGDLINELDETLLRDLGKELRPNLHLRISHTGTKTDLAGKGICSRLTKLVCDNARKTHGFKYVHVNVTSPTTRHIYLNKMNGKSVTEIDPVSWVWTKGDGRCPFKDCRDEPIANILVILADEVEDAI